MLHAKAHQEFRTISDCTIGVIILGTPHRESETEDYEEVLVNVVRGLKGDPSSLYVEDNIAEGLRVNSAAFLQLNFTFRDSTNCPIYNFYETKAMSGVGAIVRAKNSFHTGLQTISS
jgi:hypothetical protein